MLPEIGEEGQRKLMKSSVLIVGLGGLGCPVGLYLAGAGVGGIGLADIDTVSESNLHRQLLYGYDDIGMPKVEAACKRLREVAPHALFEIYGDGLTPENAESLISKYDLTVDCCDNFATRYLLDEVCRRLGKPWVFGSIKGFCGVASTFLPGCGVHYEDIYPDKEELASQPAASAGVVGPTPGVIGSIEAVEALRILAGNKPALAGKLLTMDLLTMNFQLLDL